MDGWVGDGYCFMSHLAMFELCIDGTINLKQGKCWCFQNGPRVTSNGIKFYVTSGIRQITILKRVLTPEYFFNPHIIRVTTEPAVSRQQVKRTASGTTAGLELYCNSIKRRHLKKNICLFVPMTLDVYHSLFLWKLGSIQIELQSVISRVLISLLRPLGTKHADK